jgi:DNA-binding MarR family transcriptional regulator
MDGNLVCTKNEALTRLHWQGKFRGPDFEAIAFELRPVTAAALKDSKGRHIPTVIAEPLDRKQEAAIEAGVRSDEDSVLIVLAEHEGIPVSAIADRLGWRTPKGDPLKSKVFRLIERLEKAKLVAKTRGAAGLTDKGKQAAMKAKAVRDDIRSVFPHWEPKTGVPEGGTCAGRN